MVYLIFQYGEFGYGLQKAANEEIEILGLFLDCDVGCSPLSYKEWFLDETQDMTTGNVTSIDKEGEFILLTNLFFDEDKKKPELWIKIDEIVKILDEWERVCREKPKEVMIIKEGDAYRLETKN